MKNEIIQLIRITILLLILFALNGLTQTLSQTQDSLKQSGIQYSGGEKSVIPYSEPKLRTIDRALITGIYFYNHSNLLDSLNSVLNGRINQVTVDNIQLRMALDSKVKEVYKHNWTITFLTVSAVEFLTIILFFLLN